MLPVFVSVEVEEVWVGSITRPDFPNEHFVILVLDEDILTQSISVRLVTLIVVDTRINNDNCNHAGKQ